MPGKKDVSYFSVIYNHLVQMIMLSYSREKVSLHVEALWSMLTPYIDEQLERLWKEKRRQGNKYKAMMWRVRIAMLTLYEIETLPKSNVGEKERVFSDYEPNYNEGGAMIANSLNFKDLMMRFYFLLSDLVSERYDVKSMNYMADLGYFICSPYITWEDLEQWKQTNDKKDLLGMWGWFKGKVSIISSVLDREGLQFSRRAIDQIGEGEGMPSEEMINPYIEGMNEDMEKEDEDDFIILEE